MADHGGPSIALQLIYNKVKTSRMLSIASSCIHEAGHLQHCHAQLRAMLVCCEEYYAASYACCNESGIAELQDMQFDAESSACTAYERMHVHSGRTAGSPNIAMHS